MGNKMFDRLIWQIIREVFGAGKPAQGFDESFGDPGIFGPSSVAWEIHADFVSMLIGGISALIMQSLHPDALAGVWDHSNFRQDIKVDSIVLLALLPLRLMVQPLWQWELLNV